MYIPSINALFLVVHKDQANIPNPTQAIRLSHPEVAVSNLQKCENPLGFHDEPVTALSELDTNRAMLHRKMI